ncbi:LysE family transporter [Paraburkholderia sp. HD33-4]|uniref:LysE family transporter n=1 Tax=Paraburkholderia sp. HD33-4 TaxID=2883242 RepID=UPI002DD41E8A|nr:LysE family transporter [Paraburkholderia sp. HD33-4]
MSFGLGALLRASEVACIAVKWAGAAYLVWLGTKLLLKPRTELNADARTNCQCPEIVSRIEPDSGPPISPASARVS